MAGRTVYQPNHAGRKAHWRRTPALAFSVDRSRSCKTYGLTLTYFPRNPLYLSNV